MNRQFRRRKQKQLQKQGYSKEVSKSVVDMLKARLDSDPIPDGTKVKLNLDKTQRGNPIRNEWIDSHKDDVFTVKYNPKYGDEPVLVELEEDQTWLWYVGELIPIIID